MKKTKKLKFKRIRFIFCTAILSAIMTITFIIPSVSLAYAKSDENNYISEKTDDTYLDSDDIYLENDMLASNVGSNYTYSEPDEPLFIIKNVDGVLNFLDDVAYVTFQNYSLSVPDFDLYKIVDAEGNLRFYQADVSKNPSIDAPFAFLSIYSESDYYTMYLQYGVQEELVLYNIQIPLTNDQVTFYETRSQTLMLGNDEVSVRLKASSKIYTQGSYAPDDNIILEDATVDNISTSSLNNIQANQYDSYTDDDGIIHSYVDYYFGECELPNGYTSDDPIVRIVPKELFFIPGEHIYVGKEYGFFVKVITDRFNTADYATDVMVFNISHITPSFPSNTTGSSRVTPLFQFKYRATDKERNSGNWSGYDPSLTRIVFPHIEYDYAEYYLKDIGFKFSVENATDFNPGTADYDPYADDGAFIIQTRFNARGVGIKSKGGSFAHDTALFVFGFIPYVSTVANVYSYIYNLHNGFGNSSYYYTKSDEIADNELQINTFETNNTDQILVRGNLIKSQAVTLNPNSEKPRLIHVGGYAEGKYVVARKSGSTNNNIRVLSSVSVNVVEDNTSRWWLFGWHENGSIDEYGRGTGTYETGRYKRLKNLNFYGGTSKYIDASEQRQVLSFTPRISGSYKFETISTIGDPNFQIVNASKGDVYNAVDDIDGISNRNARLTLDLVAGDTYFIVAFSYTSRYGYTLQIGYTPSSTTSLHKDTALSINVTTKTYTMVKFTPSTSGYYDFFTKKTSGDPQLYLFDSNGALLDNNDDGLDNLDSLIRCYVSVGQDYYLAVQGYLGGAVNLALSAIPSITGRSAIFLNSPKNVSVGTNTIVYEFTAPYTDSYDIYTYNITSGDPYLELYDSSRNKIAYNDDSNGTRNSLITVNLTAGQKYYIHTRSFSHISSSYTVNVRLSIYNRDTILPDLISSAHIVNDVNEVKVYKFTASESRYYTIYTNNIVTGDPYLQIMDTTGAIVYYDDDSAGNRNSKINFFANAGETYYVIARAYNGSVASEYDLIIN